MAQLSIIPCVGLLTGRWRPSRAAADRDEHDRSVAVELDRLRGWPAPAV